MVVALHFFVRRKRELKPKKKKTPPTFPPAVMTSPSPSLPHSTALRRLKAAHDASRAADALKRGDRGKAAELYLSSAAATARSCSFSTSATATAAAASRARALSNASAALCAAGRFKEALKAAEEAIRLSSPEEEEEEEEAGGERRGDAASPSLALCLSPLQQQRQRRKGRLGWSKPHWRRGAALRGLGEHLAAAMAFVDAHRALESEAKGGRGERAGGGKGGDPFPPAAARRSECAAAVREGVFRGARRAADAASLLCDSVLAPAEEAGRLLPRSPLSGGGGRGGGGGEAAAASLRAAAAAVVAGRGGDSDAGRRDPEAQNAATSTAYLSSLARWLVLPPSLPQLLVERSGVFSAAGQWRAAVADARRALELSLVEESQPSSKKEKASRVAGQIEKEKEEREKKDPTRPQQLRPAPSDAAALALARALLARPGDEEGRGDCREAARALSEGLARIRRRAAPTAGAAASGAAAAAAASPTSEGEASRRRELSASALASPLVELLKKIQESGELPPGEVGEILSSPSSGSRPGGRPPPRRRRLRLGLEFSGSSASLDATGARSALLLRVSEALRVPRTAVALEKVSRSGAGGGAALSLSLSASVSKEEEGDSSSSPSSSLEASLRSSLAEICLCPTSIRVSLIEEEEEEEEAREKEGKMPEGGAEPEEGSSSSLSPSSALVPLSPPPPPPLDLSLPLLLRPPSKPPPRLTDARGRPLPPVPRHAFALSRVHYSSRDVSGRSADSWLDAPRLGLRWRQSAGEVSVVVASVAAAGLSAAEVEVVISPRRLLVASSKKKKEKKKKGGSGSGGGGERGDEEAEATAAKAKTNAKAKTGAETLEDIEVFLDLALERMVVPDESTWTLLAPGGVGEEGLLVTLAKANAELFAAAASPRSSSAAAAAAAPSPSLTWWPRLAERVDFPPPPRGSDLGGGGGGEGGEGGDDETAVAWDDYEKDYSDLPRFAAERINAAEAALRLQDPSGSAGGGAGGGSGGGDATFTGVVASGGLDRALRRSLTCADDSRRRHRAERLREMRREAISRGEAAGRAKKRGGEEEKGRLSAFDV